VPALQRTEARVELLGITADEVLYAFDAECA
jgi:hypothetical protein